jgi:peptide-methionine (R)-S-oxide reductase
VFHTLDERMTRRRALLTGIPTAVGGAVLLVLGRAQSPQNASYVTIVQFDEQGRSLGRVRVKAVVRSDAEWKRRLSAEAFYVTRRQNTDTPFTGTYYRLHAAGLFRCICCGNALFRSDTKFDSDTGWPSFWAPVAEENIRTRPDRSLPVERTEVTCTLCAAHLGHVFDDGPPLTGLRYCINESSLRFIPRVGGAENSASHSQT